MKIIANLISRLFGPFSTMPVVIVYLLLFHTGLDFSQQIKIFVILSITNLLFPLIWFLYLRFQGRVSDIDITNRAERNQWLNCVVVSSWIGVGLSLLVNPTYSFKVFIILGVLVLSISTLITMWEKISLHMIGITVTYFIVNSIFHWQVWWLLILLILVGWARWYLHKHNLFQLGLGVLISSLIFLTGLGLMLK